MAAPKAVPTTCILWAHVRRVTLKARTILFCPVSQNVLYVWRNQAIKVIPQFQKKQNQIASTHYYFRESKFTLGDSKALSFLPSFLLLSFLPDLKCLCPAVRKAYPSLHTSSETEQWSQSLCSKNFTAQPGVWLNGRAIVCHAWALTSTHSTAKNKTKPLEISPDGPHPEHWVCLHRSTSQDIDESVPWDREYWKTICQHLPHPSTDHTSLLHPRNQREIPAGCQEPT